MHPINANMDRSKSSFETNSWHEILRRSDLKQPQLPETWLKIDFDQFFGSISVRIFIENRYIPIYPYWIPWNSFQNWEFWILRIEFWMKISREAQFQWPRSPKAIWKIQFFKILWFQSGWCRVGIVFSVYGI